MRQFITINDKGKLPERQTKYSAGYDFYMPENIKIKKKQILIIDTHIQVVMPSNEYLMIVPRSSCYKKGIKLSNEIGIIDSDYTDTIKLHLKNTTKRTLRIYRNERLVQGIFNHYFTIENEKPIFLTRR